MSRYSCRWFTLLFAGFFLTQCSGLQNNSTLPARKLAQSGALNTESPSDQLGIMRHIQLPSHLPSLSSSTSTQSFASTVGKALKVADIDRFIDPTVTGRDRALAEILMASMPRNMRGDFVYIDEKDHRIFSNRPNIAREMVREAFRLPEEGPHAIRPQQVAPGPGPDIGTGPYIRELSSGGLTALMATVTLVCNDEMLAINPANFQDTGFAYSGGTGADGDSVDAGLQYNPDGGIQPFISVTSGTQWTNQSQHYYCNSTTTGNYGTVGIFFGEISPQLLFLGTGLPENPPSQTSPWPASTTWDDAAWVYFPPPGNWNAPGTDSVGQSTPCFSCTVKRITSVGQKGGEYFYDGSCFGGCGGGTYYAGVHWGSVLMGHIVDPCPVQPGAPATTCTVQGFTDGRWFGSLVDYAGGNNNAIEISGPEEPTYASEGINLDPPSPGPSPSPRPSPTDPGTICKRQPCPQSPTGP